VPRRRSVGVGIGSSVLALLWKPCAGYRAGGVELPDKNSGASWNEAIERAVGVGDGLPGNCNGGRLAGGSDARLFGTTLRIDNTVLLLGQGKSRARVIPHRALTGITCSKRTT